MVTVPTEIIESASAGVVGLKAHPSDNNFPVELHTEFKISAS